jgi:hypothetical protein
MPRRHAISRVWTGEQNLAPQLDALGQGRSPPRFSGRRPRIAHALSGARHVPSVPGRWRRSWSGVAAARERGRAGGRPRALTPERITATQTMRHDMTMPTIAEVLGVRVATLYRHLPPLPAAPASVRRASLDS